MRKAIIYCHDIEAGLLEESTPGRGYTFTYDKQYMMDRTHDPTYHAFQGSPLSV